MHHITSLHPVRLLLFEYKYLVKKKHIILFKSLFDKCHRSMKTRLQQATFVCTSRYRNETSVTVVAAINYTSLPMRGGVVRCRRVKSSLTCYLKN